MGNEKTGRYRLDSIYAATDPNQGGHALTQIRLGSAIVKVGDVVELTDEEFKKLSRFGAVERITKKEAQEAVVAPKPSAIGKGA